MKDKKLKELFESSVLTEETKTVLQESWDSAVEQNRIEVEAEFAEKLNEAREELFSQVNPLIEESMAKELEGIAEELAEARSLEVTYAEKLEIFKESYAEKTQEMIETLVTESVAKELDEMKEDIEYAKKHQFVMSIFESFAPVYEKMFGSADVDVHKALEEATTELETLKREKIITGLLESVSGEKRSVVETLLEGVATDKLEARFESLRPVILAEAKEEGKEGEEKLTEGKKEEQPEGTVVLESKDEGKENQPNSEISDLVAERLRRSLAGIRK